MAILAYLILAPQRRTSGRWENPVYENNQ